MKTVKISMEGGVIQGITLPIGVRVIVRDYDTDDVDEKDLDKDDDGHPCVEAIWE
jgi:hypothetical protein